MPMSESEKHQGNVLGCHSIDKLEHLPIKKRRFFIRSPSPPPQISSHVEENPNFSKNQDDPFQSLVACSVSCKSELVTLSVDKADVQGTCPKKMDGSLKSIEDFSGISILAAAACSSSLRGEFGYAEDGSGVEEPSVNESAVDVSTTSEAHSFSKGFVKEEFVNTSDISIGGTSSCVTAAVAGEFIAISKADCTSEKVENLEKSIKEPSHEDGNPTVSSDVSSMRDEDVVGSQKLQSQDDRLHWDLNVVMDAWEEPSDCLNRNNTGNHNLLNEPECSMCDDKEKLLHYEPRKSLDQVSQGNTRVQVDDINYKNQIVSMCPMSVSSEYKNETPPILKPFDIKQYADSEPTGESINFTPLFTDQRNLSVPSVPDRNCTLVSVGAAVTTNTSFSVMDTQVRLTFQPTRDIENELIKSTISAKPFDDRRQSLKDAENCAKIYMPSQVNNGATMEKVQKENDHPQRSACLHEFTVNSGTKANNDKFSMNGSDQAKAENVHVSIKEVKMASSEHLEEKFIFDAPANPCSTHETETAGKLQDDNDSQNEDGELIEPTGHVWEEYDAVNEKTEHIDYVFDKSSYSVTSTDHPDSEPGQIRRIKHTDDSNADTISFASGVANELCTESDRRIGDDNDYGKDDNLLKRTGDEKMKGPASREMPESNKMSSTTVFRVRDDYDRKGRIYNLATKSPDSESTDSRIGSRVYRRGLPSQNEGLVSRDMFFREDQAGNRSKLDGETMRWDRGSSYVKSSERVSYAMQSQPRAHQVNSWNGSSDVCRGITRQYSPTYHAQVEPVDEVDTTVKEDRDGTLNTASYLSQPSTNDDSIADVDMTGNFQPNHKLHGGRGSNRLMSRGRFIRYGRQMDHGAGRGRYHGPPDNTFQSSFKYRRPLSQRDRSFSPNERRRYPFAHQSHTRSPSRSRTRSPDSRVSPRGRSPAGDCGGPYVRNKSRSPNFRSVARMPRMRSPPNQQRFGSDRMTGFRPFQRDHGSPPSSRWVSSRKNDLGHFTYKQRPMLDKSPNRIRMRGDRTDPSDCAPNPKPDPYYRPNSGRFSEMDATGRPQRLEENFDNRRRQFGPNTVRRGYEDVAEFHGRGNRDIENRDEDMPRRFRRDAAFMYERDEKFSPNSKQFSFGGMDSSRNFKSGDSYRSMNPGRFNAMDGPAGRGQRYMDSHDERRRQYSAVYLPRRGDMEGIGRRLSRDVDDNIPAPQSSCDDDATDSRGGSARGVDGRVDDLPIRQREEQQLNLSGQETKLGETSKSTDAEVPAE